MMRGWELMVDAGAYRVREESYPIAVCIRSPKGGGGVGGVMGKGRAVVDETRMFIQKLGLEVKRLDLPRLLFVKDVPFLTSLFNHFVLNLSLPTRWKSRN